jgi:hypothetical protein
VAVDRFNPLFGLTLWTGIRFEVRYVVVSHEALRIVSCKGLSESKMHVQHLSETRLI